VRALGAHGLNLEDLQGGAVVEDVQRGAGAQRRAGLGQDIGDALVVDALGGVLELLDGGDLLHARQRGGLEEVRGGHRGARQDLGAQGVVHLEGAPELLALADEDRVEHHGGEVVGLQRPLDNVDGGGCAQHADLDGVDARVDGGAGLDLVGDDAGVHGDEAVVPPVLGVHGHDAGQGRATVDAEGVEGLEVGLGAGVCAGAGRARRATIMTTGMSRTMPTSKKSGMPTTKAMSAIAQGRRGPGGRVVCIKIRR